MSADYLLIGVDPKVKVAVRFASLQNVVQESLSIHKHVTGIVRDVYIEFLLASVLLGSRLDDQESMLYKLRATDPELQINCEVNPNGLLRSTVFPVEFLSQDFSVQDSILQVVRLKQNSDVYQSITRSTTSSVVQLFREHLAKSDQSLSILFVDSSITDSCFALWIEKLPDTLPAEWQFWVDRFADESFFARSVRGLTDPDQIIQNLFPEKIRVMAVTKPRLTCTCSAEKITDALMLLPKEDLFDIFVKGVGVETRCDYCGKIWHTDDAVIRELLPSHKTMQ